MSISTWFWNFYFYILSVFVQFQDYRFYPTSVYSCSLWSNDDEDQSNDSNDTSDDQKEEDDIEYRRFSTKSTDTMGSDVSYNLIDAVTERL